MKYLANPNSPLFLQWRALPGLMPWLRRFLANATPERAQHMVNALIPLLSDAIDQHQALARGTLAEKWLASSDFVYAYESRKAFDKDSQSWAYRRKAGYVPELIEGAAVQDYEPMLGPRTTCLAVLKDHGHVLNPGAYMEDLARVLEVEGGTYRQAEARDVTIEGGRITSVLTESGALPCDRAVVTAGIWSKPLMAKLGLKVPLASERGFHLHFLEPSQMPRNPMMIAAGKFAVNPMQSGLRCAGMVELGNTDPAISRAPLRLIARHVKQVFPDLAHSDVEEWMGFRPSTPDSLPLIGEVGQTGVFAGFGHQHIGLTAGPKTGRIIAALISDQPPNLDLAPYDANRF